jgi:hypothetical protein
MGHDVPATQETHELYHQLVHDRSAAAVRRERQQLQQHLQERLLLPQQGRQMSGQSQQSHQQDRQSRDLGKLQRGDMGLLGLRLSKPLKPSSADGVGRASQAALLPNVPLRQRCLGAGDLHVVLIACFKLQHQLSR